MRSIPILLFGLAASLVGAEAPRFEADVLPVFYRHCFSCHSEKQAKPKADLRLDSAAGIVDAGVIVAGKPDSSELLQRVSLPPTHEDAMPPLKGGAQPLSEAERATLRAWIAAGAKMDGWVKFEHRDAPLAEPGAAVARAAAPEISRQVDALIERHHAAKHTRLNAPVGDEVFLRRVYLDVVGRIPSLEESNRFLASAREGRRARLIDELLASEGYVSHTYNWKADQLRLNPRLLAGGQPGWLYDDWVKHAIRSGLPHDEIVRQLITASGYLWENGAAGFYLRDLGMPLDHASNLSRIFLGTRMECAQCHDHPLEPVTQKDFFQMAAFTAGVSNLSSPSGYSNDNVKQWPELKALLEGMGKDAALQDGVSRAIAPLKRLTRDTDKPLTFPATYAHDVSARGRSVSPRTLFGDEASIVDGDRRRAFAEWLTSPRNPRFAKNAANRLWKRVMGAGLIEPVDSLSALPHPKQRELLDYLTSALIGFRFDERAFLAALLNTRLYQSEAVRDRPEAGTAFALRGPLLRRRSAEQIWDSHLVLLVPDLDQRKAAMRHEESNLNPARLRRLTDMTAEQIISRARDEMAYRARRREFTLRLTEQKKEITAAQARGDAVAVRQLQANHARENQNFFSPELLALEMGGAEPVPETDPRWKSLPRDFLRASEIPLPLPLGHFLRQFGQSDRREIDAFNRDPNTTHALALMNGDLAARILAPDSHLRRQLAAAGGSRDRMTSLIYRALLVRAPTDAELATLASLTASSLTPEDDTIWALLNSPEFLFQH
ncbi:MAG: DUF1549 domain-containing protein [Verrucomicrobia bacterium]|nr:DUF1549 domain-containing protein [Verrucomicrobiota bacterium]